MYSNLNGLKTTKMKTPNNIIEEMVEIMPYHLSSNQKPYIIEAMEIYAKEYHQEQLNKSGVIQLVSTRNFDKECYIDVDNDTDEYILIHKGVIKKRSKSRFDCLLMKKKIQKALGV